MAAAAVKRTVARAGPGAPLRRKRSAGAVAVSERLFAMLTAEVEALETAGPARTAAGEKARIERIGATIRNLEKLIDLRRLERLSVEGVDDGVEARRLAAELVRRLRLIDRRRASGAGLVEAGAAALG